MTASFKLYTLILDQKILAINFVDEFYKNVHRGFDTDTMDIFAKLKHSHFDDVLYPAKAILNSDGSDNGAAMYIAPIALLCVKNAELNLTEQVCKAVAITHHHEFALNGAILQGNAIHDLVKISENLNAEQFVDQLIDSIKSKNVKTDGPSFVEQLQHLKKLLNVSNPSDERVVNVLGHSPQAIYSVPTALYCFLRGIKQQNQVRNYQNQVIKLRQSSV